jgi:hypothetical protein
MDYLVWVGSAIDNEAYKDIDYLVRFRSGMPRIGKQVPTRRPHETFLWVPRYFLACKVPSLRLVGLSSVP